MQELDLSRLNPEQRQAVETTEGPVLVLAGAGSGKTTVLTTRLAYIIQTGKALPFQCLAVTFTNKAANEMTERLQAVIGEDARALWLGTFHKIGLRILRNHPEKVGLSHGFTILDAADQERLLKQIMTADGLDLKENPPPLIMGQIQRLKDQGLTPDKANQSPNPASPLAVRLYEAYQTRLQAMNAVDFGDLLLYCVELFQKYPDVLKAFQRQFRYILVDEYQDTNIVQYLWLRLLAGYHHNLCCVGDDDQSIYSWRGAEVGNILRFEQDFPNATLIRLESNYRSTAHILAAASGLIANNVHRLSKTLHTAPGRENAVGEKVVVTGVWSGEDEARKICDQIETEQRHGTKLSQIAVLVRASFQTRAVEDVLLNAGIPYKVIAGMRFYEREEIRDASAYIRLLVHPKDDMAFLRIVNKPRRGIGDTALQNIQVRARADGSSMFESAHALLAEKAIKGTAKTGLEKFFALFDSWRDLLHQGEPPEELLRRMLDESGYMEMRRTEKTPDAEGRVENLQELVGIIKEYDNFDDYLEYISLVMENDTAAATGDSVSLMTLHAAKGLEFHCVFLPGWEEGIFPHQKSLDEGGANALEEERRLAYVGITRAKKQVYISFAGARRMYNQWQNNLPSRFINELPTEHVRLQSAISDNYGYGGYNKSYTNDDYSYKNNYRYRKTGFFNTPEKPAFQKGTEVYHERFGHGRVTGAEGKTVQVYFDEYGTKKVMADYLEKL